MKLDDIETQFAFLSVAQKGNFHAGCYPIDMAGKLLNVVKAAKAFRDKALKYETFYTCIPCQYGERLADALEELEKE